jgi:integral membrane protein
LTVARFRLIATAEAVSWLVLIVATVAKHGFGVEGATTVIGPIHGVIVLAYLAGVAFLREDVGWSGRQTLLAIAATVIPLGTFRVVRDVERDLEDAEPPAPVSGAG